MNSGGMLRMAVFISLQLFYGYGLLVELDLLHGACRGLPQP